MKFYKTLREAREALDKFLGARGKSYDGAHYIRPSGKRGPIVRYNMEYSELLFAVDRLGAGWYVAYAWEVLDDDVAIPVFLLRGFEMREDNTHE